MKIICVFTQNLKLSYLTEFKKKFSEADDFLFITTHYLFENERNYISKLFFNSEFKTFADFLTDSEMEKCDVDAFVSKKMNYEQYIARIRKNKNKIVRNKVLEYFPSDKRYILCDDLGIDVSEWKKKNFKQIQCNYYYNPPKNNRFRKKISKIKILVKLYHFIKRGKLHNYSPEEVNVSYFQGKKYVFLGNMNRIRYRLDIDFKTSEQECLKLNSGEYENKEKCIYMTTWHEHSKCRIPDDKRYEVKWAQDGYLPPNYTHYDYDFKPDNVTYFCWDILGMELFKNRNLPYEMIPFRKKLYLPNPIFPNEIKNVLIVASGSGDWTALKNRSDDDIMVDAFVKMARKFPDIRFTYRCHPTWIHPLNVGVNAINRVSEYFNELKLDNLILSGNMPIATNGGGFQYSFSRSSLDEDLANSDFVFGEHSISMIDAAFKKIPFCSVNITKRRNFFIGINELGFPTCSSVDEISEVINHATTEQFEKNYINAIIKYNSMTNQEK